MKVPIPAEPITLEIENRTVQGTMYLRRGFLILNVFYLGEFEVNVESIRWLATRILSFTEGVNHHEGKRS